MCPASRSFLQPRLILPRGLIRECARAPSEHWTYHVACSAVDEQGRRIALYSGPTQCTISDEYKEEEQFYRSGDTSYQSSVPEFTPISTDFLENFLQTAEADGIHLETFDFDSAVQSCQVEEAYFADSQTFDTQSVVLAHVKQLDGGGGGGAGAELPEEPLEYAAGRDALVQILSEESAPAGGAAPRPTVLYFEESADYGHNLTYVDSETYQAMNDDVDKYMDESLDHISLPETHPNKNKAKHPCLSCTEMFSSLLKLRSHVRTQHNDKSRQNTTTADAENFYCDRCSRKFSCRERWQSHMRAHSDPDLECSKCSKVLGSKGSLKAHQRIHNRKFSCEYCARTYETEVQFKSHVHKKHSVFQCDLCEFSCRDKPDLETHQESHFSLEDIRLDEECILQESFLKGDLADYEQNEKEEEDMVEEDIDLVVVSRIAPEEFEDIINLQQEDDFLPQFYTEEDNFQTDDFENNNFESNVVHTSNSKKLDSAYKVVSDIIQTESRNKHTKVKKKLARDCAECDKHFDRGSDYKRHAIEHVVQETYGAGQLANGSPVFRCQLCEGGRFGRVDKLKAHLRHHLRLRLYQCGQCNKTFSDSSNYSKHKKVHGADVYQCDTCKRKFNTKKMITQHMDYHKRTQPLHCQFCGKEYYFESNLKKHVNVHHRSKGKGGSFSCQNCHRRFPSMRLKWDHQWAEHGIRKKVNDCDQCKAKFRKYSELKRHFKEHH